MCIRYIVYKIVTVFKSIKINIGHEKFLFDNLLIWDFSTEFPLDFKALFYLGSKTQRLNYILRKFFICERIFRGLVWFLWVSRVAIGTPSPKKIVRDTYDWHVKRSFVLRCTCIHIGTCIFLSYDPPPQPGLAKPTAHARSIVAKA